MKNDKKLLKSYFGKEDLLSFWIADMDFRTSEEIIKTLQKRGEQGVFNYESINQELFTSFIDWNAKRHNWNIEKEDIKLSPSVLTSLGFIIDKYSDEGDSIIIQTPVFFQFKQMIKKSKREAVANSLKFNNGKYEIDFEDLEEKAKSSRAKILILCNPHNPVGRVWREEELEKLSEIAIKNNLLVVSDEIHGDIVLNGNQFIPMGTLKGDIEQRLISILSPAKTFNIPAVSESFFVSKNREYIKDFENFLEKFSLGTVNTFNVNAMLSAYRDSKKWLERALTTIEENLLFVHEYLKMKIPEIKLIKPEGTFLLWLDLKALEMTPKELENFLTQKAGLAVSYGHWFGRDGAGFIRFNIATDKELIEEALKSLKNAVEEYKGNKK